MPFLSLLPPPPLPQRSPHGGCSGSCLIALNPHYRHYWLCRLAACPNHQCGCCTSPRTLQELQRAVATLAFTRHTQCEPYRALFDNCQWQALADLFLKDLYRLYSLPQESLLVVHLQAGLSALNTPLSYQVTHGAAGVGSWQGSCGHLEPGAAGRQGRLLACSMHHFTLGMAVCGAAADMAFCGAAAALPVSGWRSTGCCTHHPTRCQMLGGLMLTLLLLLGVPVLALLVYAGL